MRPPVLYVPWILVDGRVLNYPNRTNEYLLGRAICEVNHLPSYFPVKIHRIFRSATPVFSISPLKLTCGG